MDLNHAQPLAPEVEIALANLRDEVREMTSVAFALDARLSRIVAQATEPMIAQMRLAWWRDELRKPATDRPNGDAVLDAIGARWAGDEDALIAMVDGWEELLREPPLQRDAALRFVEGRAQPFVRCASSADGTGIVGACKCWALADLAAHSSNAEERDMLLKLGSEVAGHWRGLNRDQRGFAVLAALAGRAMKRGGRPLMEGRGAALLALRVGLFGR